MIDFGTLELWGLTLLRPSWLMALPLVLLLGYLFARRVTALAGWDKAIDPQLLDALQRLGQVVPGPARRNWMPVATALLVGLALVGPAREAQQGTTFRNLDGLVVVMDVSRSVAEGGQLQEAITAVRFLTQESGGRPVALVVYAGDAYLASGFTTDAKTLGTTLALLDGDTVPDVGSRPERGLALAREVLAQADILAGDVLMVTDGGGIGRAALDEAEAIEAEGGRISAFRIPASAGPEGKPGPDPVLLERLVRLGGGEIGSILDPLAMNESMSEGRDERLASGDFGVLLWRDYGRFLLLLALLPALLLFRRGA